MAKQRTQYCCSECGAHHTKWFGCCPSCNAWGTLEEQTPQHKASQYGPQHVELKQLDAHDAPETQRLSSGIAEWDRVSGGGIVPGSFMMVTGDPGNGHYEG